MLGRPRLYTAYRQEAQLLPTWTQKVICTLFVAMLFLLPFELPVISHIPLVRFLGDNDWMRPMALMMVLAIAALGLNLLAGVAGQVSLGHAFFMGVGACAAVYLGGSSGEETWGHSLPIWIWLPAAGIVAAPRQAPSSRQRRRPRWKRPRLRPKRLRLPRKRPRRRPRWPPVRLPRPRRRWPRPREP